MHRVPNVRGGTPAAPSRDGQIVLTRRYRPGPRWRPRRAPRATARLPRTRPVAYSRAHGRPTDGPGIRPGPRPAADDPGPGGPRLRPVFPSLPAYQRSFLRSDTIAGIALVAILIPQGMAYAEIVGLPPVTGLYATMLPIVGYALLGSSRQLVVGPDSSASALVAAVLLPLGVADPAERAILAATLAIMVGLICIVAGLLRLGFIADFLSRPVLTGYINGLSFTIIVGQLPKILGFSVPSDRPLQELLYTIGHLSETNPWSLAIGLLCLAIILGLARVAPRVPGVLVAVLVAMVLSVVLDLGAKGVALTGHVPSGLPSLAIPNPSLDQILAARPRRLRARPRLARRHDRHVALVRGQERLPRRRRSRPPRARRSPGRRRAGRWLPDQRQRLADRRRRVVRRADAGRQPGRRRSRRARPSLPRPGPRGPAEAGPRRGRPGGRDRPVRLRRDAPLLRAAPARVLGGGRDDAHGRPRGSARRADPGDRDLGRRRAPPGHPPEDGDPRPARRLRIVAERRTLPGRGHPARADRVPGRGAAVLRQRGADPGRARGARRGQSRARSSGSSSTPRR